MAERDGSREHGEELLAKAGRDVTDFGVDPSLLTAAPAPNGPIPDHTLSGDDAPPAPPEIGKKRRGPLGSLGDNRKRASGVRQLTNADQDKIVGLYVTVAMGVMLVKPDAAQVIATQAEQCAAAWRELAKDNDSVRRALLFLIEGGAWGAVMVAHLPIVVAFLPEETRKLLSFVSPTIPDEPPGNQGE